MNSRTSGISLLDWLWRPVAMLTGIELAMDAARSAACAPEESQAYGAVFEKLYEAKHGSVHVPFFKGTFEQAKHEARQKGALLVACFTASANEGHELFLRETIGDPALAESWGRENIVVWMGDVVYSSTPLYHLAMMLDVKVFPAVIFIAAVDHRLVFLRRVDGFCGASFLLTQTADVLTALAHHQEATRERQQEMGTLQRLRAEQDLAYQRSLEMDARKTHERAQLEAKERETALKEERETAMAQAAQRERALLLETIRTRLGAEYGGSGPVRLSMQMPDGQRHVRQFSPNDSIGALYDWAFTLVGESSLALQPDAFVIRTLLPPTAFARLPERTLAEAGISTQMKLIIELK